MKIATVWGVCLAAVMLGGPAEAPWDALRHISKRALYTVLSRDGSCQTGTFRAISESALTLLGGDDAEHALARADILRVSAGEAADVRMAVYSGRSSWADLQALQGSARDADLLVVTADERRFKGRLLGASEDQLILFVDGKDEMRFAKAYVARALLTSVKPAAERTGLHRGLLAIPKKVMPAMQPVPLYEVNAREDNSRVECAQQQSYRRQ